MNLSSKSWLLAVLVSGQLAASPLQKWMREGNYQRAIHWINQQSASPELQLLKVRCLLSGGQNEEAKKLLESLPSKPSALYFLLRGRVQREVKNPRRAAEEFEAALKFEDAPGYQAEAACGLAELEATEHWERTEELWQRAVALASQSPEADWGQLYFSRIQMLRSHGGLEEALTTCRLASQACPWRSLDFRLEEASSLILLGRYQEADDLYLRLAHEQTRRPRYWLISGVQMALGKGRPQRMASAREWLKLGRQARTTGWTAYDRFYFLVLQGYIEFIDQHTTQALKAFHQAELVLGNQASLPPSGTGVRLSLAFHQLSPEGQSELGLCCWASAATMMQADYPDASVDRFMEEHSSRLPAAERVAWLVVLGNSYRKNLDPRSRERYQQALELSSGKQRQLLTINLLQKRFPANPAVEELDEEQLDDLLATAAVERLSPEGLILGPFAPLEAAAHSALEHNPELEQRYRQREQQSRQKRSEFSIVSSSLKLAYLQILQNRLVEAQASLLRALERETGQTSGWRLREQLATLEVLAGRPQSGLQEMARVVTERETAHGRSGAYWSTILRQAALAHRAGDTKQALQLGSLSRPNVDRWGQSLIERMQPAATAAQAEVAMDWVNGQEFLSRLTPIRLHYPEFETAVAALPPQFLELGQNLPDDSVLIQYFVAPFETVQMLSYRGRFALRRLEVDQQLLSGWIGQLRHQISGHPQPTTASRMLYDLLIPDLPASARLVIIPQGPLYDLPWDLLVDPQDQYLGDRLDFRLWTPEATASLDWHKPQRLLGLGDVTGAQLPASRTEVMKLAEAFPGKTELLLGNQASGSQLMERIEGCDVVHLASHAHLDPPTIELSDGSLGLEQIYRLPLKPGSLVILSQCGSGEAAGQTRSPLHLASGFLAAGASQVVATLTPVGDEEVSQFMASFYGYLGRGLAPNQALRQAKQECRKLSLHGDWASFVLISGAAGGTKSRAVP